MKRLLVLLIALLLLAAVGIGCITVSLIAEDDRVTVTEHALYGDPALARSATVKLTSSLAQHLHWETTYTPGGEATSDYDFTLTERREESVRSHHGIMLNADLLHGYDLTVPLEQQSGLARAYRELYDNTQPGTTGRMSVRLQDYYDYYPLRLNIDLPGTLWNGRDYEDLDTEVNMDELAVWDAFIDFFKIPIPENLAPIEIHITKSQNGLGVGWGQDAVKADEGYYDLFANCAYSSDRCFFSVNNRMSGESRRLIDTSLIPGGYGIYSFTYRQVRNTEGKSNVTVFHPGYETGIDANSLAMVYPLDPSVQVQSMHVDPTETRLLLVTEQEDGSCLLTVIDIATMKDLQQIALPDTSSYIGVDHRDGFLLLTYGIDFQLYSVNEQGLYVHEITAAQPSDTKESFTDLRGSYRTLDWNGEYLIMGQTLLEHQYGTLHTTDFCLAVYDASGLLYYGEYRNSLSVNPNSNLYEYNCLPVTLDVSW